MQSAVWSQENLIHLFLCTNYAYERDEQAPHRAPNTIQGTENLKKQCTMVHYPVDSLSTISKGTLCTP